jgi:replication factor A1
LKLAEITAGMKQVNVNAKVIEISETREVMTKFGTLSRVATVVLEDDSGRINLSLWNDDIPKVSVGSTVEVTNGYITTFRGDNQLNVGKFGKLNVS